MYPFLLPSKNRLHKVTAVTSEVQYTNRTSAQHLVQWFKGEAANHPEAKGNRTENILTLQEPTAKEKQDESTNRLPGNTDTTIF